MKNELKEIIKEIDNQIYICRCQISGESFAGNISKEYWWRGKACGLEFTKEAMLRYTDTLK